MSRPASRRRKDPAAPRLPVLAALALAIAWASGCAIPETGAPSRRRSSGPGTARVSESERAPLRWLVEQSGLAVSVEPFTGRTTLRGGGHVAVLAPGVGAILLDGRVHALEATVASDGLGGLIVPRDAERLLRDAFPPPAPPPPPPSRPPSPPSQAAPRQPAASAASAVTIPPFPRGIEIASNRRWRYIVIHHSATDEGGARSFDRQHRTVNHWENGLGYHFVIGNGTHTADGQIEVGPRWSRQNQGIDGAHAGAGAIEFNRYGIGICLVGNFDRTRPSPRQLEALRRLVALLRARYGIPLSGIRGHRDVRPLPTDCPGRCFPFDSFVRSLR